MYDWLSVVICCFGRRLKHPTLVEHEIGGTWFAFLEGFASCSVLRIPLRASQCPVSKAMTVKHRISSASVCSSKSAVDDADSL